MAWECVECGKSFTIHACVEDGSTAPPAEGDITICIRCGAIYELCCDKWELLPSEKFDQLPDDVKRSIVQAEAIRQSIAQSDSPARV